MSGARTADLTRLQEELEAALLEANAPLTTPEPSPVDRAMAGIFANGLGIGFENGGPGKDQRDRELAEHFTQEGVAEFRAWQRGGPPPTTAGGLELMCNHLYLDGRI